MASSARGKWVKKKNRTYRSSCHCHLKGRSVSLAPFLGLPNHFLCRGRSPHTHISVHVGQFRRRGFPFSSFLFFFARWSCFSLILSLFRRRRHTLQARRFRFFLFAVRIFMNGTTTRWRRRRRRPGVKRFKVAWKVVVESPLRADMKKQGSVFTGRREDGVSEGRRQSTHKCTRGERMSNKKPHSNEMNELWRRRMNERISSFVRPLNHPLRRRRRRVSSHCVCLFVLQKLSRLCATTALQLQHTQVFPSFARRRWFARLLRPTGWTVLCLLWQVRLYGKFTRRW